ncbi:hypothetical protein IB279_17645 [Ensifer sp. ENS06]|uniref:hypothetical protein n=1 Tax=Ensifer sp. ENS06 TaxID=2769276 RepID=UPI0017845844|nr:hypothetical protein [Ensifer sp. ENS06]MBD9624767.1 hypothetical protein [Ensifer sp. ENS06]
MAAVLAALELWLEDHDKLVSLVGGVVGFLGFLLAIGSLIYNIRNNTRTRDFTSVIALQKLINEEKLRFQEVARVKPRNQEHYKWAAADYFNTLELVAFTLNKSLIGSRTGDYLVDWMKAELDWIYQSKTQGSVMRELMAGSAINPFKEIFEFHPPRRPLPESELRIPIKYPNSDNSPK